MRKLAVVIAILVLVTVPLVVLLFAADKDERTGQQRAEAHAVAARGAAATPKVRPGQPGRIGPSGHARRGMLRQVVRAEVDPPLHPASEEPPSAEEALAADRARFRRLEQQLRSGPSRPARERRLARELTDGFVAARLDGAAKLGGVDCRGTMCAVDLRYEPGQRLRQGITRVLRQWLFSRMSCPFHMPGADLLRRGADGAYTQRIYIDCRERAAGQAGRSG
jgi:hypothetical protein